MYNSPGNTGSLNNNKVLKQPRIHCTESFSVLEYKESDAIEAEQLCYQSDIFLTKLSRHFLDISFTFFKAKMIGHEENDPYKVLLVRIFTES